MTTATRLTVRQAIARVEVYVDDLSEDYAIADHVVADVRDLAQPKLYAKLVAAGLEGLRPHDSKVAMLRRLHNRLTARIRARERNEV